MAQAQVHLLLQEALVQASASLLLLRSVALTSLVTACRSLVAAHQRVVEFALAACASEAAYAENVVARLHRPVDANQLALQAYVHDIHIDIHRILAIRIHWLIPLRRLTVLA